MIGGRWPKGVASEDAALFTHGARSYVHDWRALHGLARKLCLTHALSGADLNDGFPGAPPLSPARLRRILRAASLIAENRRFAPRRFVIKGAVLAAGKVLGLHMPQGLEFQDCIVASDGGVPLIFEDFSLESLHFGDCNMIACGLTLRDGAIGADLSFLDCAIGVDVECEDVRIGQDFVASRFRPFTADSETTDDRVGPELTLRQVRVAGHARATDCQLRRLSFSRCGVGARLQLTDLGGVGLIELEETEIDGDLDIKAEAPTQVEGRAITLRDVDVRGAASIGGFPLDGAGAGDAWLKLRDRLKLTQLRCGLGLTLNRLRLSDAGKAIELRDARIAETFKLKDVYAAKGVEMDNCGVGGDLDVDVAQSVIETGMAADNGATFRLAPFSLCLNPASEVVGRVNIELATATALDDAGALPHFWQGEPPNHAGNGAALEQLSLDFSGARLGALTICGPDRGDHLHPVRLDLTQSIVRGEVMIDVKPPTPGAGAPWWSGARLAFAKLNAETLGFDLAKGSGDLAKKSDGTPKDTLALDLAGARLGRLEDRDLVKMGSHFSPLSLAGMGFERLSGAQPSLEARRKWLYAIADFDPPLWLRYARALEELGQRRDGEAVHIALRQRQRAQMPLGMSRAFDWALDVASAYGFAPMRALSWFALAWIIFTIAWCVIGRTRPGFDAYLIEDAPMTPILTEDFFQKRKDDPDQEKSGRYLLPVGYPPFQPGLYALDLMTPVIDLGAASHWAPNRRWAGPCGADPGKICGLGLWILKILNTVTGLALLSLWIAGLAGLLRRGEDKS